jgi:hypothetical protein
MRLPPGEPGSHAAMVGTAPIHPPALRAPEQQAVRPEHVRGNAFPRSVICHDQRGVIQQAPRESATEPVQLEVRRQAGGKLIKVTMRQDQRHPLCRFVLPHQPVAGQEIAPFGMASPQQLAITQPISGKQRVISCRTQVAAQPPQHLVAQETGFGFHAGIVHPDL